MPPPCKRRRWRTTNRRAVAARSARARAPQSVLDRPLRWSSFLESERERECACEQEYEIERDEQLQEWPRLARRSSRQQCRRRLRRSVDHWYEKREAQHRQQQFRQSRVRRHRTEQRTHRDEPHGREQG